MNELKQRLQEMLEKVENIRCDFDLASKAKRLAELEKLAADPDFWNDAAAAQATMREMTELRETVETWQGLESQLKDDLGLLDLIEDESDPEMVAEIDRSAGAIAKRIDELEFELTLSGPYDKRPAILAIHAGAGGTEAQDWAQMLLRMYLRWAERHGYKAEILDETPGEEAGIKSAVVEIRGPYAYGYAKAERGVHRLVRISPFDAAKRRHTSFALVEVLPEPEEAQKVEISPEELRVDVFRSSGAGGQNVQKNSTAIRLTHLPTGIVVTCQNERSQLQNRETALTILAARLAEIEEQKREAERSKLKGEHVDAGWGNQIRSYVLHPYNMVKDHRTSYETSNTVAVLDGELEPFMESYLRWKLGEAA
ncbi:MAG TPA: peptide chain release factor 2 [Chloroflexota bacterium]|nr:peptide chain release factor 2 [Chloroflexota bacterium]